jgi:hypothetical protein
MAHTVEMFLDGEAEATLRGMRRRLADAGVPSGSHAPSGRPSVTLAAAGTIPAATRKALRAELRLLSLPNLWLSTLGTFPAEDAVLLLSAVVDTELLAVHSTVHDVLAGKVTNPSAYHFPGAWIPHCPLARSITSDQLAAGFAALLPLEPVRAKIHEVGIADTRTGEVEMLS